MTVRNLAVVNVDSNETVDDDNDAEGEISGLMSAVDDDMDGEREEDVPATEQADEINKIPTMSKDQLAEYAETLGVTIDRRRKISELRDEVTGLVDDHRNKTRAKLIGPAKAQFVLNEKTGFVFHANDELLKRDDLIPCDSKGKPLKKR